MEPTNARTELIAGKLSLETVPSALRLAIGDTSLDLTPDDALIVARALTEAAAAHATALAAATDDDAEVDPEASPKRLPMQFVVLDVERDPEADPDEAMPPNAEVCCWIKEQSHANAVHVAVGWVNESDWIITNVSEHRIVDRSDFEGTELLPYYEQALTDDEVFLYVTTDEDAEGEEAAAE
jgi:hypothetical protein